MSIYKKRKLKPITQEDIRAVLTEDNFSRKNRRWNLINYRTLLEAFKNHHNIDWKYTAKNITKLKEERKQIEARSNIKG